MSLDSAHYVSGSPIRAVWTGSPYPNDRIGLFRRAAAPRDGICRGQPDLWLPAHAPFGAVAFTTPLPPGDYVAHLLRNGGFTTLTQGVPFSVRFDAPWGRELATGVLIGPDVPGGQLADPQVTRIGDTYYITGTYSGAGGYVYATRDFRSIEATWMEIDTTPWPYPYQHIWAFEIYRHVDGTLHGYAFDFDRKGLYHFVPGPDPATTNLPVVRWKQKERLLEGDYDNRVVHDGTTMYLLTAKGNAGHISIYCQRMLDPGTLDPDYEPHRIMSEAGDGLDSERRNAIGAMKIHECPSIARIAAPGGTKYVMSYTVGDYGIRDYKIGLAYSDVLIPPRGTEYTKATLPDTQNVWGSGPGAAEVVYLTQTQKPSWPNYHAAGFNRPGSGDIVELDDGHYLVYHAAVPIQMTGMAGTRGYDPGRMSWIMPIRFDFTGPIHTWARPGLPDDGARDPDIRPSRSEYSPGEDIVIHFDSAGQSLRDWIGIYRSGDGNDSRLGWQYVQTGTQAVPNAWTWERTAYAFAGTLTFPGGQAAPGAYEARLFFCNRDEPVAARCRLTVAARPNRPPEWSGRQLTAPTAEVGVAYAHTVGGAARDPDGDRLSFSLRSAPTWLEVAPDGRLSGVPPRGFTGTNTYRIGVTDGNGDAVETVLAIGVAGPATAPRPRNGTRLRSRQPPDGCLRWSTGPSAIAHHVYLGSDRAAVVHATRGSAEHRGRCTQPSMELALEAEATYYWRVDTVYGRAAAAPGTVWTFETGAAPGREAVPAPMAWYNLDDSPDDSSGNGHHGIAVGELAAVRDRHGKPGGAYQFKAGSYIDLSHRITAFKDLGDHTVSLWVRGYSGQPAQELFGICDGTSAHRVQYELSNGHVTWAHSTGGAWQPVYSARQVWDPERWHHLVFVSDRGQRRAYVDATEVLSSDRRAVIRELPGLVKLALGAIDLGEEGVWANELQLDDVRIWGCALTAAEIFEAHAREVIAAAQRPVHPAQ